MSRTKVLLIFSCVCFVIFVLLSFFNGSSILWSLFKACVSTCLATVFLLVSNFFLLKYIPDFFSNETRADETDDSMVGSNLDIRINDTPLSSIESSDVASSNENSFSKTSDFEVVEDADENDNALSSSNLQPLSFSNDDEKMSAKDEGEGNLPIDNMREDAPIVSDKVHIDDANLSEAELSEAIEKDVDRLEELPDLQEFVDSSNLKFEQTRGDELMDTGTQSFFATDLSEDVSDTNLMAKAVRTVLKREV